MSSPVRESVERASLPVLEKLSALPRVVPFLAVLALMVAGAFVPYGWVLLLLLWVFLAWILYLAWPRLARVERVMRLAVLLMVAAVIITRVVPR